MVDGVKTEGLASEKLAHGCNGDPWADLQSLRVVGVRAVKASLAQPSPRGVSLGRLFLFLPEARFQLTQRSNLWPFGLFRTCPLEPMCFLTSCSSTNLLLHIVLVHGWPSHAHPLRSLLDVVVTARRHMYVGK